MDPLTFKFSVTRWSNVGDSSPRIAHNQSYSVALGVRIRTGVFANIDVFLLENHRRRADSTAGRKERVRLILKLYNRKTTQQNYVKAELDEPFPSNLSPNSVQRTAI